MILPVCRVGRKKAFYDRQDTGRNTRHPALCLQGGDGQLVLSAIIIGPFPELYFGPPYLVEKQHHPVSFFVFCLLPFFASNRFWADCSKIGS